MVIVGLVLVLLVGIARYLTGVEVSFSIFYLIPVGLVSWFVGRKRLIEFYWYLEQVEVVHEYRESP